jgi:hypothetical protein
MGPKALKRLSAAFLLLAGAWAVRTALEGPDREEPLWPEKSAPVKFEITRGKDRVALVFRDGTWTVSEPFEVEAAATLPERFVETLLKAKRSAALASDRSRHARFGVDVSTAPRLRVWSAVPGDPRLDLRVGWRGASVRSFFSRRAGSDSIHEIRGMRRELFDRPSSAWMSRRIFSSDPTRLLKFDFGKSILKREGERWTGSNGEIDEDAMRSMLHAFSDLEGDSVHPKSERPERPWKRILVTRYDYAGEEAAPVELLFGPFEDGRHRIWSSERPNLTFRAAPWRFKTFASFW